VVSIRGKLFLLALALISVAGLISGVYMERQLRALLAANLETNIERAVHTVRVAFEEGKHSDTIRQVDPLADRLGVASETRVTVVREDGTVLGDSHVDQADVAFLSNHGQRPEIRDALQFGLGRSRRLSQTLGKNMLYLALPYDRGHRERGVVRLSVPMDEIDQGIWNLRMIMVFAGLLGLAVAALMTIFAAGLFTKTLRQFADNARALATGERKRLTVSSHDEIGRLAGSFNRIAADLERTVGELADERDRFETVLASMGEAVLAVDNQGRITLANPACVNILSLSLDAVGRPIEASIPIPEIAELAKLNEGANTTREFSLGGTQQRWIIARAARLHASTGVVIVMHDFTKMRRLEAMRRNFVANVSHELRTPVSVIRATSEVLLDGAFEDTAKAREFLEALMRNSDRLARIIDDLLDLSRLEGGHYPIHIEPISVRTAVRKVIETVQRKADQKGIALLVHVPEQLLVSADAKGLDQILINLLDNAVKYTPDSGKVEVRGRQRGHRVRIEVHDNGPGIARKYRTRVFQRFYRVDKGRSRDTGGTGLGLSIVKHLLENMGGRVGLFPAKPNGCIFWFSLPVKNSRVELAEEAE
jgi:two-component system, OmpR family, phosphate regulon sensor histidine kinase PhoR